MSKETEALMTTLLGNEKEMVTVIHSAFEDLPRLLVQKRNVRLHLLRPTQSTKLGGVTKV
jgi:hypothetical protein